ncbi:hypothetical protein LOY67_19395 [Pseudomonas sp. B21-056]|jgi:hypothetical protein|uniref:hypothetical protein n=1 Tax=Pseudomonas sp. B21-056 TaxID=2895495 RepID=UPI002231430A|nr:hypothetical protein [Pseudomonas sp. B21-056]UZE22190.1 hypothetical protein LOY67_19395 [Pseudomonas sp. B21-056]
MDVKREVAMELALAGLLKAAGPHKDDLIQRANAVILGGQVDEFGGGTQHKSAACTVIADIAGRI